MENYKQKKKKKELNEELKDVNDEMRLQRNSFRCIFEKFWKTFKSKLHEYPKCYDYLEFYGIIRILEYCSLYFDFIYYWWSHFKNSFVSTNC